MINAGNRREFLFDTYLINEEKSTTKLILNKPVPKQIVMTVRMRDADLYSIRFGK